MQVVARYRWLAMALTAMLLLGMGVAAQADAKLKAKITRNAQGIPTIEAEDFKSLGYGYAYAFAQDNICTIADTYLTSNAERSKWFGPEEETPEGFSNLDSDLFYQRIKDRGTVKELMNRKAPSGPKKQVKQIVSGYVKGYNAYLEKTGVENIPDPRCAGQPWVRPITKMDVYQRFYELVLYASGGVAIDGQAQAQPPAPASMDAFEDDQAATEEITAEEEAQAADLADGLDLSEDTGSNGWGLGKETTKGGGGIVLANPHFPWQGPRRFYQSHLVVPGKLNVSGASLFGVPLILIGHNDKLAWTHTVSTAYRFTPIELDLDPTDPTKYVVDGQSVPMERDDVTVEVKQPDGSVAPVTRSLYTTQYGPVTQEISNQSLFAWTNSNAYAMFDANADNARLLNHYFDTNRAESSKELLGILRKYQGIPWVNTIASDSKGKALYADIGAIPNVDDAKVETCSGALGAVTFPAAGLPVLDGSRSECALTQGEDAAAPGLMSPNQQPSLLRNDWVANGNDSYWLTNPAAPLEGFPRIIGNEQTQRSLRTRLGIKMIQDRLAGEDRFKGNKFTAANVRRLVFQNRFYAGELWRDELVAFCNANPTMTGTSGEVDVSEACGVLANWDRRMNVNSRGAILFERFMDKVGSGAARFSNPFSLSDPVNTPFGLNTGDPVIERGLADAVTDLRAANLPLDAAPATGQFEVKGDERIPIHGGEGGQGVFNAISTIWEPGVGYSDVTAGSSFVMVTSFKKGAKCPKDRSILTYSLSENPNSKHYADQTRMYSQKEWVNPPFCASEVEKTAKSVKVVKGG